MNARDNIFFWLVFITVLSISTVDLYLLIRFQNVIAHEEKNIIGLWLIHLDSGSTALFSAVKMFGTCLSLMLLKKIFLAKRKIGYVVGSLMAAFQIVLIIYLLT
jgi:hypothetical protein